MIPARVQFTCSTCGHPMSAVSPTALLAARQTHLEYAEYVKAIALLLAPPTEHPR